MPSDDAQIIRRARVADRGPWPAEPIREPPPPPSLEERVRRLEVYLYGDECPTWVLNAVENERALEGSDDLSQMTPISPDHPNQPLQ